MTAYMMTGVYLNHVSYVDEHNHPKANIEYDNNIHFIYKVYLVMADAWRSRSYTSLHQITIA